ncbi:MAG: hypothetical protein JWP83_5609 [Mycobacterium sp.]|jgi:hypothetical protein|nr:hypothetical protein [Mycobacterium sp.]
MRFRGWDRDFERCDSCGCVSPAVRPRARGVEHRASSLAARRTADRAQLEERARYAGCRIEHAAALGRILSVRW